MNLLQKIIEQFPQKAISKKNIDFISRIQRSWPEPILYSLEVHAQQSIDLLMCFSINEFINFPKPLLKTHSSISSWIVKKSNLNFLSETVQNIWFTFDFDKLLLSKPWYYCILYQYRLGRNIEMLKIQRLISLMTKSNTYAYHKILSILMRELPRKAFVFGISIQIRDIIDKNRIILSNLSFKQISRFLKKINWPGNTLLLHRIMEVLFDRWDFKLIVDFNIKVLDEIGIEIWLNREHCFSEFNQICTILEKNEWILPIHHHSKALDEMSKYKNVWINHVKIKIGSLPKAELKYYIFLSNHIENKTSH